MTLAAICGALALSAPAGAAVIAYDGFAGYSAGANLNGGTLGAGWAGNWVTVDDHTTVQTKTLVDPNGNVLAGTQAARLQPAANLSDVSSFIQRSFPPRPARST